MQYTPKLEKELMCPIEYGLAIFGGKWKSRILCVLSAQDVMRYNEIRKELGNITTPCPRRCSRKSSPTG